MSPTSDARGVAEMEEMEMDWDAKRAPEPPAPEQAPAGSDRDKRNRRAASIGLVAAGLITGAVLAGTHIAGAQSAMQSPSAAARSTGHAGETPLTGTTAEKVRAAALKAVPGGTIIRVETDADGSPYEAHVRKADGSEVEVKVDKNFNVTSIEEGHGPGHGGMGETALTGTTAAKVKAAALKAVPGGTVLRVETDSDGSPYEAHVRKADGTEVVVKVDKSFNVTGIEEGHGPGHDRGSSSSNSGADSSSSSGSSA
jgi:uncharacterized membrane protein YkoI